jgi:hypothetical protein
MPASLVLVHVDLNRRCHGDDRPAGGSPEFDTMFRLASVVARHSRSASRTFATAAWEVVRDSRRRRAIWVECWDGDCPGREREAVVLAYVGVGD